MMPSWSGGCFRRRFHDGAARTDAGLVAHSCGAEAARRDAGCSGRSIAPSTPKATPTAGSASGTATGGSASSPTMRQTHVAGEKLFVDWAGDTMPVFDPTTGEEHAAHIFVAALGASNYTYAEARWTETLPDWIGAHVNALAAIGGVPKALVPDNLKAGITKPSRYEPGINRTYQDLADHYGCVVLPARVRKPRDKAKVEVAVRSSSASCWRKLRNRRFFSLAELNAAIRDCVAAINAKVMRRSARAATSCLRRIDRPALNALPSEPYHMRNGSAPRRARLSRRGRRPLLLGAVRG